MNSEYLNVYGYRDLRAALNHLTGNSPGFDVNRDPRTAKKADLIAYLLATFSHDALTTALAAAAQATPEAARAALNLPSPAPVVQPPIVNVDVNAGLKALQDLLGGAVDENRIRAIAAAEARIIAEGAVNETRVREIASEVAAQTQGRRIDVAVNNGPVKVLEGAHPLFEKVLRLAKAKLNIALVGPAGCGKTFLSEQVADTLGVPYGSLSYTSGASESWLLGRFLPTGEGGRFEYQSSAFCDLYVKPSVFCHDEFDAADPNMTLIINKAVANGGFDNPVSGAHLKRSPDAVQIACLNTFGTGATVQYNGRSALDAAALDRWYFVVLDYDPALEAQIAGLPFKPGKAWKAAPDASPQELAELGQWVLGLRDKATKAGLRRVVSTRALQKAVAARKAGIPTDEVKNDLVAGWTKDELAKVGA